MPNIYENTVPLYIDDPDIPEGQPCLEIKLKGEAVFPKLLFDRRELILPVVPLNIEAKCTFKIINDGYDSITLKYRVLEELGNLNLRCDFPEGNTLGVSKNKLKVDVYFIS